MCPWSAFCGFLTGMAALYLLLVFIDWRNPDLKDDT